MGINVKEAPPNVKAFHIALKRNNNTKHFAYSHIVVFGFLGKWL